MLPSAHFNAYVEGFDDASGAARDWFVEHLRPLHASRPASGARPRPRRWLNTDNLASAPAGRVVG